MVITKRIVCYTNLNSFNCPEGVTDEHMRSFFENYFKESNMSIVDVVVDRCEKTKPLLKREGWKRILAICEARCADCVVVPSIHMLEPSVCSLIELSKEFDYKYRTGFFFMLEDISGTGDHFIHAVQLQATIMRSQEFMNKNADKMRRKFYEATGLGEGASARPVLVEYALYEAVKKKAYEYGDDVETLVRYLLRFATDPKNEQLVEKYVYGVDSAEA